MEIPLCLYRMIPKSCDKLYALGARCENFTLEKYRPMFEKEMFLSLLWEIRLS